MSEAVTKKDLKEALDQQSTALRGEIKEAVTDLSEIITTFAHQVDERFNKLETRMDEYDRKLDRLINTIDGFIKRLDEVETEQTARDAQFERLLEWAREVSKKTGIPLRDL